MLLRSSRKRWRRSRWNCWRKEVVEEEEEEKLLRRKGKMFYSKEQCQIQVNFDKSIKRLYFLSDSFSFLFPFIMHHNFSKGNFIFSWISCHKIAFIVHFRLNTFLVSIILPALVSPPLFHFLIYARVCRWKSNVIMEGKEN